MSSNGVSALETLSKGELKLLISGLTSLEGALNALNEPSPENIEGLKQLLKEQIKKIDVLKRETMTTQEVAARLRCTDRHVLTLGQKGKIERAKAGRRGRGYANLYYTSSVEAYRKACEADAAMVDLED